MRPRVALDVTPMLYTANGIGRCTRSLVETLVRLQPEIDFTLYGRRLGGSRLRVNGHTSRTVHLRLPRRAEALIQRLGLVEMACRADLYHATDFYSPLRRPERAVATIHDVIFLTNREPGVDHVRLAKWVGAFAQRSRAIITCSNWCKQEIVRVLGVDPARVRVIYWGVDRDVFYPVDDVQALRQRLAAQLGVARPYFLAVSCSTGRKNTPRLLRAFDRLLAEGVEQDLVATWDPPEEIRQQYAEQVAAGRIRFVGRVSDALLRDLYAGTTATLYPSMQEGFGLPMLEAMSCGSPVIASAATCLPEVAGGAATLVDPSDENDMARAMAALASNATDAADLRRRGLAHAEQFTWERCARQTLDVYRSLLGV